MDPELRVTRHNLLAMVACVLCIPMFGVTTAMAFSDSAAILTVNGAAKILPGPIGGSVLLLTPRQQYQAGTAFTTNRIAFNPSYAFSTFFQFQMTNPGPGGAADGITFTLQAESPNALGINGGSLGYEGIAPSVAVEFDTWQNSWDINGNHVAILTGGQMIDIDSQTPYAVTDCQPSTGVFGCMSNGDLWSVWIDYDGTRLNVAIADNSNTRPANLISYPIDIPSLLGQKSAFVGFTAGTGADWQDHVIVAWNFTPAPADSKER